MDYKAKLQALIREILYDLDCDEILDRYSLIVEEAGITEDELKELGFEWFLEDVRKELLH